MTVALSIPVGPGIVLTPEQVKELVKCALSFEYFAENYYYFRNPETGEIRLLRPLWPGQRELAKKLIVSRRLFDLKARKLGITTLGCAFDLWVARFRDTNGRVHLFSRQDDAAKNLLSRVHFGHQRLPDWMKLPCRKNAHLIELTASADDVRSIQAYPADEDTAVEESATHVHIDEWARMKWPKDLWQAVEPTVAMAQVPFYDDGGEGGSVFIMTTGKGPANYPAEFWKSSLRGETGFKPVFLPWWMRPGRTADWYKRESRKHTKTHMRQEYPATWHEALRGDAELYFASDDIERAHDRALGLVGPISGRDYYTWWDIGRLRDAAVGTVIDVLEQPRQVVAHRRLVKVPFPQLRKEIESLYHSYPGFLFIEDNGSGLAVLEDLEVPAQGRFTSATYKAEILTRLKIDLEQGNVKWDGIPQLDLEMEGYELKDSHLVQDCVMSLAGTNYEAHMGMMPGIPDEDPEEPGVEPIMAGVMEREF